MHVNGLHNGVRARHEADPQSGGKNLGETVEAHDTSHLRLITFQFEV